MNRAERRRQRKLAGKTAKVSKPLRTTSPTPGQQGLNIQQAIELAVRHNNLGLALQNLGALDEAVASYRKALDIKPDFAEAHCNLGNAPQDLGALDEAVASYRKAFAIKPDYAEAHNNLGNVFRELRKMDEAVASYRKAIAIWPDFTDAHNNLGNALQERGRLDEAVASYRKAITIKPDYAEVHNNLGLALMADGRLDEAIVHYQKAIGIKPDFADVHNNLGYILQETGRLEEAEQNFRRALEFKPDATLTLVNLGNVLKDIAYNNERTDQREISAVTGNKNRVDPIINGGLWEEAHACAEEGLSLTPNNTNALALKTSVLLALNEPDDWAALVDCDRLIQIQTMSVPEGYADLTTFNESLLQRCANDPSRNSESFGKSIRMGQRIDHLQHDPYPGPVSLLLEFANEEAKRYCTEHPIDAQHPFLAQYPSHWNIIAWGSILGKQGHHESHIHGDGWLSGVYYGKLPDVMDSENRKREGWIKFGRPNNYVDNESSPEFHFLRPREGMMILFPSYFYHQTVPLESDDTRFTVAFDLIPSSR